MLQNLHVKNLALITETEVEFNDGYALADSQYFSYSDGDMLLLPGYEGECVIKAFYRKKRNKKKVKEILEEIENVVNS